MKNPFGLVHRMVVQARFLNHVELSFYARSSGLSVVNSRGRWLGWAGGRGRARMARRKAQTGGESMTAERVDRLGNLIRLSYEPMLVWRLDEVDRILECRG